LHVPHNYSRWSLSPIFFRSIKPPNQSWFQTQFYAMPFTVTVQTDLISFLWSKWPPNLWSSDLINLEGINVKSSPAFRLTETRNCCISVLLSLLSWLWSIVTGMIVVIWLSFQSPFTFFVAASPWNKSVLQSVIYAIDIAVMEHTFLPFISFRYRNS
jgi:hypothetical protein